MRLILSLIMFIASGAGIIFFIIPEYQSIQDLRTEKADYNQILTNARKLQEQRNKLVDKYNAFEPTALGKLTTMLPTTPENVKLILELDAVARQYGMILQNVKIEDATKETQTTAARAGQAPANPDIGTLKITFSLAGPYNGFVSFVKTVERNLRIVDFQKVSFTSVDETKSIYQYTVDIKTYWLK